MTIAATEVTVTFRFPGPPLTGIVTGWTGTTIYVQQPDHMPQGIDTRTIDTIKVRNGRESA